MAGENGTNIRLKLNGNVIAGKLNTGFTSNRDEIELSDADDGADASYIMGRKHREMSGEFNLNTTATNNDLNDLWDAHDNATLTPFIYGGEDSGDFILTGNCYIRDIELADPDNERSTVTVTFRVTGTVTKTTYA
jgi:hypothetical protein